MKDSQTLELIRNLDLSWFISVIILFLSGIVSSQLNYQDSNFIPINLVDHSILKIEARGPMSFPFATQ